MLVDSHPANRVDGDGLGPCRGRRTGQHGSRAGLDELARVSLEPPFARVGAEEVSLARVHQHAAGCTRLVLVDSHPADRVDGGGLGPRRGRRAGQHGSRAGLDELARVSLELLSARVGAEEVSLARMLRDAAGDTGIFLVHSHPADRVDGGRAMHAGGSQPHLALGIEEEIAGDHQPVAHGQPFAHLDLIPELQSCDQGAGLEYACTAFDKDLALAAALDNGVGGDDDRVRQTHREFEVDKHLRLEHEIGVGEFDPELEGAGDGIELRQVLADSPGENLVLAREADPHVEAGLDQLRFVLEHVGENPHAAQVSDPEQVGAAGEALAFGDVPLDHEPVGWSRDIEVPGHGPGPQQVVDLLLPHAEAAKGLDVQLDCEVVRENPVRRPGKDSDVIRGAAAVFRGEGVKERLGGCEQLRPVAGGQQFVLFHAAAGRERQRLRDPAVHRCRHPVGPGLVERHPAQQAQRVLERPALDRGHADTDKLLLVRADLDRAGHLRLAGDRGGAVELVGIHRFHFHAAGRQPRLVRGVGRVHRVHVMQNPASVAGIDGPLLPAVRPQQEGSHHQHRHHRTVAQHVHKIAWVRRDIGCGAFNRKHAPARLMLSSPGTTSPGD